MMGCALFLLAPLNSKNLGGLMQLQSNSEPLSLNSKNLGGLMQLQSNSEPLSLNSKKIRNAFTEWRHEQF
ncbi:hypothetical protein AZH47_10620 [Corynebacterium striatum]|nr:hypothetical protein AZH47_10620 [Corynebacterium striatum]